MPAVGLGTWESSEGEVGKAITEALQDGYRHIDCAAIYGNEPEIGQALHKVFSEGKIKREDVFITSKLWSSYWGRPREALEKTLHDLQLQYLDLYLIHHPFAFEYVPGEMIPRDPATNKVRVGYYSLQTLWGELENLMKEGFVKAIGVSNFPGPLLRDLLSYAKTKPAIHQIEIHPYFTQERNVNFARSNDIHLTAYSPLGRGKEGPLTDPLVKEIAFKHKVSPAQVLIRWAVDKGFSVIPKSVTSERIKENFSVLWFKLSEEEVKKISDLNKNQRVVDLGKLFDLPYFE